jgi:tetratricopeptide (TPR) repeat protein
MKSKFVNAMMIAFVVGLVSLSARGQTAGDYEQGVREFKAGNYTSAYEHFSRAEALKPGNTDALLYEGKCRIHLQNFAGAEKALREYASIHRDSADTLYLLGFVLNRQNRPAESLELYTQAAALVRPSSDDLKIVGLNYVLLNDYADAIHWLERAVQLDAGNKDAWYYLGRAYYTQSRLPAARKAFLTVLELNPRDGRAENNLGLIFESSRLIIKRSCGRSKIRMQVNNPMSISEISC